MKTYNTIDYYGKYWNLPIYAFDKLDGSNIRFEYNRKRGFYKFGTRNVMIDEKSEPFGFVIDLFKSKYEECLTKLFREHKDYRNVESIVCFAEVLNKDNSSAFGQHNFDKEFDIILFDVNLHKKGLIPPKQFINDFEQFDIPKLVYQGNLNMEFVQEIKQNKYNLSEGVICKGLIPNKKNDNLYYCKIKTNDWFDRLRGNNIEEYEKELKQFNQIIK